MQAAVHSIHRLHRAGPHRPPARQQAACLIPRAARRQPALPLAPRALRCYSEITAGPGPAGTATAQDIIRASGFLPQQIQQVLIASRGMGFAVVNAAAGAQQEDLEQAAGLLSGTAVPGRQPGGMQFVQLAALYDPDEAYRSEQMASSRLLADGRQGLHARTIALCYTVTSAEPWRLLVGGADLQASRRERIDCAEISFPANCLVQINLVKGMLHGFDGRLAGVCTGLARQRPWGWLGHEDRRCAEARRQGWDATTLAIIEPARLKVIAERAVPYATLRQWQDTVPIEKTPDAIAWEIARTTLPM